MEITERVVDTITILDVSGKLTIGEGAQLLKEKSESLVFQGRTRVIVNLAGVAYIDSGGLGQLVACCTTLARRPAAGSTCSTWARGTTTCCRSPSWCRCSTRSIANGKRSRATPPRRLPEIRRSVSPRSGLLGERADVGSREESTLAAVVEREHPASARHDVDDEIGVLPGLVL